jgi:hypothetical protein
MGSIPPASSVEYDQREIVAVIKYAYDKGLIDFNNVACAAPSNSDLTQLLKAIFGMTNKNKLQADVIIYTNSGVTGDDLTGDGTAAKPYKTIQKAINTAQAVIDVNRQHKITFKNTGTFTQPTYLSGAFAGQAGMGSIVFDNTAATFETLHGSCFSIYLGASCMIKGGTYAASWDGVGSSQGIGINCGGFGGVNIDGVTFGVCASAHIWSEGNVQVNTPYTIAGSSPYHWMIMPPGGVWFSSGPGAPLPSINVVGNPGFTVFARVHGGELRMSAPITGTATGQRYNITGFGVIGSGGGGPNKFPGTVAGTIATNTGNGEYI